MVHYVIVEPANGKLELADAPPVYEIGELVPACRPELTEVAPVLYCAEHPDEQLPALRKIAMLDAERRAPPLVCAIVASDRATGRVQQHLADRLILSRPDTDDTAVFRYYDPRVFTHLNRILRAEQFGALLGPLTSWAYLDPASGWTTMKGAGTFEENLAVTQEQYNRIVRIELVQRALDVLRANKSATPPHAAALLDAQFAKGAAYGLDGSDLLAFAIHGLLVSPYFDRHPRVMAILQTAQPNYVDSVTQWDASDWETIARESLQYQ
ncbi:DUF4123 domain-containing protein [Paraburkholderia sp. D15]|uniref:DUF4123 domain-containing protein n=1 Tax=Paraburkholderia sp. D15 TaxID=2880218 RepID=UPI00247B0446|nr:DUF4123 domain-containing protein [Paraburkholderia sp. D15]WGS49817.1 DUF4123 domain-containing protein [Paraburkholderia sp. D15]